MESKDGDKKWKILFALYELGSPCVCASSCSEESFCGWTQRKIKKEKTKRVERSRTEQQNSLSRKKREKTFKRPSLCDGFVFRHYEDSRRYIEQYRENHSISRVDSDIELRPVLGVNFPDPYLPKISDSSILLENVTFLEAISTGLYQEAATKSIKNVRPNGRADTADRKIRPRLPSRSKTYACLPSISQTRPPYMDLETHSFAAVMRECSETKNEKNVVRRTKSKNQTSKSQSLESSFSEEHSSSAVNDLMTTEQGSGHSKRDENFLLIQSSFSWNDAGKEKSKINFRTKHKARLFECGSAVDSSDDTTTCQKSNEIVTEGSVYPGITLKPNAVSSASAPSSGECELSILNSKRIPSPIDSSRQIKSRETLQPNSADEKDKTSKQPSKNVDSQRLSHQRLALPFIRHVGKRQHFHYVLHAHAYKPSERYDGAAVTSLYWK